MTPSCSEAPGVFFTNFGYSITTEQHALKASFMACFYMQINFCSAATTLSRETWWRHHMETFSALLALCAGNSPVTGEFHAQRPVTRGFHVFFGLCMNGWVNNRKAGDLRRHRTHYDVTVMLVGGLTLRPHFGSHQIAFDFSLILDTPPMLSMTCVIIHKKHYSCEAFSTMFEFGWSIYWTAYIVYVD